MAGTGSFSLSLPPYFIPVICCCKKLARVSSIHSSFCLKKNCIIDLDLELLNFRRRRIIFPKKYSRKYQYIWYIFSFLLSVALIVTDRIVAQLFLIGDDDGFLPQKTDYFKPPSLFLSISINLIDWVNWRLLRVKRRKKEIIVPNESRKRWQRSLIINRTWTGLITSEAGGPRRENEGY